MAFVCKDICHKLEVSQQPNGNYTHDQKYCSVCGKFLFLYIRICPCCGTILRMDRKNKRRRRKRTGIIE